MLNQVCLNVLNVLIWGVGFALLHLVYLNQMVINTLTLSGG